MKCFNTIVPHSSRWRPWKKALNIVDEDHLETGNGGVNVCQWQASLQHLCSHHSGDKIDPLLRSPTWRQCQHPAGRLQRECYCSRTLSFMPGEPAIVFLLTDLRPSAEHNKNFMSHNGVHTTQTKDVRNCSTITQRTAQWHTQHSSIPFFINPADSRDILMLLEHSVHT